MCQVGALKLSSMFFEIIRLQSMCVVFVLSMFNKYYMVNISIMRTISLGGDSFSFMSNDLTKVVLSIQIKKIPHMGDTNSLDQCKQQQGGYLQTKIIFFGNFQPEFTVAICVGKENAFCLTKIDDLTPDTKPISKIDYLVLLLFFLFFSVI